MELITTHTHTCFTNHGEGTVEELVSAAVAAGVSTIAVTEHYPMTATFDPDRYLSMPAERMGEYLAAVEAAREAHPEIEVLVGCEMDWLGDDEDRVITAEDVAPFQLILGSVHLVDRWPFDDPAQRGRWDEVGADLIWRRYFEVWCEAVSSDAPFHVMSHPDLAKKFGFYPSFDPQPLYEQAAEACAAAGRMVEVNTSPARRCSPRRRCWPRSAAPACPARWAPTRTCPPTSRATSRKPIALCTMRVIER